jgi:N-methylhydantoinase B
MQLDPVLLEILANKAASVADEMSATLQRASRSTFVKEAADFCTGIVDRNGQIFAYPPSASVQFLVDADWGATIRAVSDVEEGDVIITNDPYRSQALSTHLPDIHMIKPYHHKGEIVAYGWCFIHFTDVGGSVPSSIAPSCHELFQEGLVIPPMKVVRRGVLNEDFVRIFRANCRIPDINMGDIQAMLGALNLGGRRVADMIERHGLATFLAGQTALQDYASEKARAVFRRLPDGDYEFWDFMDDDLVSRIPVRVRVKMTVKGGDLHLDVTGTDPQVAAAYNVPTMGRRNYWLTMRLASFVCTHDKTAPMNAGLFRPITVTNPPGTVLNAEFPDAVGIRSAPSRRLSDALTGAILKAAPDLMAAPTCGASAAIVLAEYDGEGRNRNVMVLEPTRGGLGAGKGFDGVDARDPSMSNLRNHPVEAVEAEAGVLIREYDIRPDSSGAGEWRGGVGQHLTVEILRHGSSILSRGMERLRFPAFGVCGGRPGKPLRAILNKGRAEERPLTKIDELKVQAGETVTFLMPGASGYGDPYRRPAEKVRTDVEQGFVSRAVARREYGVVIGDDGRLDAAATKRLRAARPHHDAREGFDFGPEREAWEAVFDDALMGELNRRLYALPKSVRYETRRRIFETALPDLPVAGDGTPLTSVLGDPEGIRARVLAAMEEAFGEGPSTGADRRRRPSVHR